MSSNAFPLDRTKFYTVTAYDWMETVSGAGYLRLYLYNSSMAAASIPYIDMPLPVERLATGWNRVTKVIRPYTSPRVQDESSLPDDVASGILAVIPEGGMGYERYIGAVDVSEGQEYEVYSPFTVDSVAVSYNGLVNGSVFRGAPVLRTDISHLYDRHWSAEDASKTDLTYDDVNVETGTEYTYVIDAYDKFGNKSPLSATEVIVAGDVYPPAQVSGLSVESAPNALVIYWTSPADTDFEHVKIYSDSGLTTLVWREFGKPGEPDQSLIGGLNGGTEYSFWVTTVDKYGNENTTTPPTVTGTTLSFAQGENMITSVQGPLYLRVGTYLVFVYTNIELAGVPTVKAITRSNQNIDVTGVTFIDSASGIYRWSGNMTLTASHAEGTAYVYASGTPTATGVTTKHVPELFIIDRTAPTATFVTFSGVLFSDGGGKKWFNGTSPVKVMYTLSDPNAASGEKLSGPKAAWFYYPDSSSNPTVVQYSTGVTNAAVINVGQMADGAVGIYCAGEDAAGNFGASALLATAYVDRTPPIVLVKNNDEWGTSATPTIYFETSDPGVSGTTSAGFSGVRYAYKVGSGGALSAWATLTGPNPSVQLSSITDDLYLYYYGVDNVNNKSPESLKVYRVDSEAPVVGANVWTPLCRPIAGGFQLAWDPTQITDNRGVKNVIIWRTEVSTYTNPSGVVVLPYAGGQRVFNDTSLHLQYNKTYWWWMQAEDFAGNMSTVTRSVSGTVGHDVKGVFRNLLGNGSFERLAADGTYVPVGWTTEGTWGSSRIIADSAHGSQCVSCNSVNRVYWKNYTIIDIGAARRYIFSFYHKSSGGSLGGQIGFVFRDANKQVIATALYPFTATTSWARSSFTIGNSGDINYPSNALCADIYLISNTLGYIYFDGIQLEEGANNTSSTPTDFQDSYVISGDILQGARIRSIHVETKSLVAENIKAGVHGSNMIMDSSFESIDRTLAASGWMVWSRVADPSNRAKVYSGVSLEGQFSLLLSPTVAGAGYWVGQKVNSMPRGVKVNTANNYTYSIYHRPVNTQSGVLRFIIECYGSTDNYLGSIEETYVVTGNASPAWERRSFSFGPGTSKSFPSNTYTVWPLVCRPNPTEGYDIGYYLLDCIQLEEGLEATVYTKGGGTDITGGMVTTGRVQSSDGRAYFDLDTATVQVSNTTGDYAQMTAGRVETFDAAGLKSSVLQSGALRHTDIGTGNYSQLTDGVLEFYNAASQQKTNYGLGIQYMTPYEVTCGSTNSYPKSYSGMQLPYVIPIANRVKTFSGNQQTLNQFVGFEITSQTDTTFVPRAYLYIGDTASSNTHQVSFTDNTTQMNSTHAVSYSATYDAKDEGHGSSSCNKVTVTVRVRNQSASSGKVTLYCHAWVCNNSTYNDTSIADNTFHVQTVPSSTEWAFGSVTFSNLTAGSKSVKLDWYSGGSTASQEVQFASIDYSVEPQLIELTGTGIYGVLIVGRST